MNTSPVSRRHVCFGAAASVVGLLSGCSSDPNSAAEQAKRQPDRGYISGDGSLHLLAPGERDDAVTLSGTTLKDRPWGIHEHLGSVVVVNLWVSWCGPCHEEAPDLVAAYREFRKEGSDVEFIGIDYRESSLDTGRAQARSWGLPYDSIYDAKGETALQMQGKLAAQPSTAVLDREGRIAAVVLGAIDKNTLVGLVRDALREG
ncbi:TlpA disulfide reductase family protein [Janibacter sp. FSL W8-0316]|uniref:TlpA family protein disulfide reductase n=1 Tax=Janibacter sp. FSL W8-0316 TaxID=2975325 RepID=UPI0030FCBCCB